MEEILGRRVVAYRLSDDGSFDLIFDDGTELEVYIVRKRGRPILVYGVEKYRWFPAPTLVKARSEANRLREAGVYGADVVVIPRGEVYVAVPEKELGKLGEICRENHSLLVCRGV